MDLTVYYRYSTKCHYSIMTVSPDKQERTRHQLNNLTSKIKPTVFKQFLEIVGIARQLQYERRAANFLRNVIIEEL